MPAGRPTDFSPDIASAICEQIADGLSVRTICDFPDMPAQSTVYRWLRENEGFQEQYARAREAQADAIFDEILDIADDARNDWMLRKQGDDEIEVVNTEHIQRSKLRIDARKWMAAKLQPKKYGDKLGLTGGDGEGPISLEIVRFADKTT